MSSRTILLFDTNYLCRVAQYTTGGLSNAGVPTGVAFGVLRKVEEMKALLNPDLCVFAFDYGGKGKRAEIYPGYKASRSERREKMSDEEKENEQVFHTQVKTLFREILPGMGFSNIFRAKGYEADDIIAKIAVDGPTKDTFIIISGDEDFYQLLAENVICRTPKGVVTTAESFRQEYGIYPSQWAMVKSIAGCSTDDVVGVKGIGEKTAAKFLLGKLNPGKKLDSINENLHLIKVNSPLVTLPFPGTPEFDLQADECTDAKRKQVYASLGMQESHAPRMKPKMKGFDF